MLGLEALARLAQHRSQRAERLLDEREAELVHAREVAVERGRDDAGRLGDAAQAERVEALAGLDLQQRRVEQRLARVLAALRLGPAPCAGVRRGSNAGTSVCTSVHDIVCDDSHYTVYRLTHTGTSVQLTHCEQLSTNMN